MSRRTQKDISQIFSVAQDWRDQCLIAGRSLLWPELDVWCLANLERFKACFIDRPDTSQDKNFERKFREQLGTEGEDVTRLACELLLIYFLFPSSVTRARKIGLIQEIAKWKNLEIDENAAAFRGFSSGIGDPGLAYNTGRPNELTYLARVALAIVGLPEIERSALLADHTRLRAVLDNLAGHHREEFSRPPQLRHVILYLLFPDLYEPIASEGHKSRICEAFGEVLDGDAPEERDDYLKAVRNRLEELLPDKKLDFYWEPLRACWYTDREADTLSPLQALNIKQQIVLYGPPGTGKTYQARQLAYGLIRQKLLKLWGPKKYFSAGAEVDQLVVDRTHRVQFHPGYGYEDFVRGLQIGEGGKTEYRDGVLLSLIDALNQEPDEKKIIPTVVILDEMNRADLSKVLGECFSLLEDRDADITLAGHGDRRVRLPRNIYFIGTMNLIDQSLEHVDFALRRRFLWFFRGFSIEDFIAVSRARWEDLLETPAIRKEWGAVEEEFQLFAKRAEKLNKLIDGDGNLGSQYQIGHTYFCDIVAFARRFLTSSETRRNRVLFNGREAALEPVRDLWRYSLRPLLEQYLSGIDTDERDAFLKNAESQFCTGAAG